MTDQQRAQALGINGDPNVYTPNLDNMSRSGLLFTDAVGGFPLCCPFRGSMLTSFYPHKCVPGHQYRMDPSHKTIANVFNDNGYDTFYLGKWHLDGYKEGSAGRATKHIVPPEARGGFKTWIGYENNNSQWDTWIHGGGDINGGESRPPFQYRLDGYETDVLTDMMIEYIGRQGDKKRRGDDEPFFAVLSVQPPHNPCMAPERNLKNHNAGSIKFRPNVPDVKWVRDQASAELSGYYAMIENIDENVGRIWEALRKNDLLFDTHIIFFSDHGDMHGSHGYFRKTSPLEESVKIPFIIAGEQPMGYDHRGCGKLAHVPVNHVDIAPTTLGLCGIKAPAWMEGTDYSHYRLRDNPAYEEPDSAYLQQVVSAMQTETVDKPWRGILTKDGWKYACFENHEWIMYNLNDDPYEQVNLCHYGRYWPKMRELNARLQKWIDSTGDKFSLPKFPG